MIDTRTPFTREQAPCGRHVSGHRHREDDESGMVFDDIDYDCGCRVTSHQFHDGSLRSRVVRHDGRVLRNELSAEHAE